MVPELDANVIERTAAGIAKVGRRVLNGQMHKDPWDRRAGETSKAFEAFCLYRDMGTDRTITIIESEVTQMARNWSGRWEWRKRAEAWDDHLQALAKKELETAKVEMAQRQARIGVRMQVMAENTLNAGTVLPQSIGEVVKLVEVGSRVERMARGEATSNQATVHVFQWEGPLPAWAPKEVQGSGGDIPREAVQPIPRTLSAEIIPDGETD